MVRRTSKPDRPLFVRLSDETLGRLRTLAEANGVVTNYQAMVKWAVTQFIKSSSGGADTENPNSQAWANDPGG